MKTQILRRVAVTAIPLSGVKRRILQMVFVGVSMMLPAFVHAQGQVTSQAEYLLTQTFTIVQQACNLGVQQGCRLIPQVREIANQVMPAAQLCEQGNQNACMGVSQVLQMLQTFNQQQFVGGGTSPAPQFPGSQGGGTPSAGGGMDDQPTHRYLDPNYWTERANPRNYAPKWADDMTSMGRCIPGFTVGCE